MLHQTLDCQQHTPAIKTSCEESIWYLKMAILAIFFSIQGTILVNSTRCNPFLVLGILLGSISCIVWQHLPHYMVTQFKILSYICILIASPRISSWGQASTALYDLFNPQPSTAPETVPSWLHAFISSTTWVTLPLPSSTARTR